MFDLIGFLCSPGFAIGALVGVGLAVGLHWLLPDTPAIVGGLVVAVCSVLGFAFEGIRGK